MGDAAAALIVLADGRYLLQLRDDIPGIFYPGHWGCFGGALSPGETPLEGLRRELAEELEFSPEGLHEFMRLDFALAAAPGRKALRAYYEVPASEAAVRRMVLHEGAAMRLFAPAEIFDLPNVTPYDSFALWLHAARHRVR